MNAQRRWMVFASQLSLATTAMGVLTIESISPLTAVAETPGSPDIHLYVSPSGDDTAGGTVEAPFKSVFQAQKAARKAVATMNGNVTVDLAPGVYRLDRTLKFDESDSGRNGHKVIYRSSGGLGKARLLGSIPLKGWKEHRDGIWKIDLPEETRFHTLYETGKRAWKARFPNYEHHPDFPMARGRYLLTEDGTPKRYNRAGEPAPKGPGWLTYPTEDTPPALSGEKAKLLIYTGGKCDWNRSLYRIRSIDPAARKLIFEASSLPFGVGAEARFFLEDDLSFLDAPGEFFVDEEDNTLFYKPMGKGNPDTLGISAPVVTRLIQFEGKAPEQCVSNIRLEGLALEETDGFPLGWWSTLYGLRDGALVWMRNTTNIEIEQCHLKNGGRNGVVMVGHNTGSRVTDCEIGHMGVNGVTLSNRWHNRKQVPPILDRCEDNLVHNCRIHHVGEIHTYAACLNLFNVSNNEISHCDLHDSVRYAVTVRGNTGPQYGPPISQDYQPECKGNRLHHLRTFRCGQDGGDMGTLHCANLNNPGGGCVNTFEQITVADSRAHPSMTDYGPDGIFLDWPKMAMDQIFRNVQIIRSQGKQVRSNRPDNADSAQTSNVSWKEGFDPQGMKYESIGLTTSFPTEYGGRTVSSTPPPAPVELAATASAHDTVDLKWHAPKHEFREAPLYTVFRNGELISQSTELRFTDTRLEERTRYEYAVAVQDGDLSHSGARSKVRAVETPSDLVRPTVENAWSTRDGKQVRVLFSKPMEAAALGTAGNYKLTPPLEIAGSKIVAPDCVELEVKGLDADTRHLLTMKNLTDDSFSRNQLDGGAEVKITSGGAGVFYPMQITSDGRLLDRLGSAGDARLIGGATVEKGSGPFGGPALVLDGESGYAEASAEFDLGAGDFTLMLWMKKEGGPTALSKGNGFGSKGGWSFGWPGDGVPQSVALRIENVFHSTAAKSVPPKVWVHTAFVRKGDQGLTYVNGERSGGPHDLSGAKALTNDRPLRIGRRAHEPNPAWFKGQIAHVKILNRALSETEIREYSQSAGEKTIR